MRKGRGFPPSPCGSSQNGLHSGMTGRVELPQHFVPLKVKPYWIPLSVDLIYICFYHPTDVAHIRALLLQPGMVLESESAMTDLFTRSVCLPTGGSGQMCKEDINELLINVFVCLIKCL